MFICKLYILLSLHFENRLSAQIFHRNLKTKFLQGKPVVKLLYKTPARLSETSFLIETQGGKVDVHHKKAQNGIALFLCQNGGGVQHLLSQPPAGMVGGNC